MRLHRILRNPARIPADRYQTLREQLLIEGTGFRRFAAPVIVVALTDGLTLNVPDLLNELATPPFDRPVILARCGIEVS